MATENKTDTDAVTVHTFYPVVGWAMKPCSGSTDAHTGKEETLPTAVGTSKC